MEEKFNHLLASNNLEAIELGKYCRKHGLYTHQLLEWRKLFIMTKNNNALNAANHLSELKALKEENKRLEKEIRRKDKALAEAAALLILKKKAAMIFGEREED
jgi:transposase-like protein